MAMSARARATAGSAVAPPARRSPFRPRSGGNEGVAAIADDRLPGWKQPPAINAAPVDDVELVRRLCARDSTAFAALYDRHAAVVHGLVLSILRDPWLAEEVTHDVFLGLWQRPTLFDAQRGTFSAWLLRVARNRAIDLLRRQREHPFPPPATSDNGIALDPLQRLVDPEPGPADRAIGRLVQQDVRAALTHLSPDQSRLLHLAYFEGFTQREIASRLDRPLGTVKSQIRVAMKRLADLLAPPPPQAPPVNVSDPDHGTRTFAAGRVRRGVTEDAS